MITAALTSITARAGQATITAQQQGIFEWVNEKTTATQTAIQGILIVVALIVGVMIAWRGKNVGSVVMGIIVGGLIASLPILITFFSSRAQGEVTGMNPTDAADTASQMITYARAVITTRV